MLNEGVLLNDDRILVKSEMIRSLADLGRTTPQDWERDVFKRLTGQDREHVDWDVQDNQAGYFLWVKSFDALASELAEDGYLKTGEAGGAAFVEAVESPPDGIDPSQLVYRPRPSAPG